MPPRVIAAAVAAALLSPLAAAAPAGIVAAPVPGPVLDAAAVTDLVGRVPFGPAEDRPFGAETPVALTGAAFSVPTPGTLPLTLLGVAGLLGRRRRRGRETGNRAP